MLKRSSGVLSSGLRGALLPGDWSVCVFRALDGQTREAVIRSGKRSTDSSTTFTVSNSSHEKSIRATLYRVRSSFLPFLFATWSTPASLSFERTTPDVLAASNQSASTGN